MVILSGSSNVPLARSIAKALGTTIADLNIGRHPDGEIYVASNGDLRGRDVFIIQSTCPPVNDYLQELLIMIDAAKRSSAARITAVLPYFGYARADRRDQGTRTGITAKLVARQIEVAGADRVVTMDLHSAQIQGFFDIPVDHLYAKDVFVPYFKQKLTVEQRGRLTVCSPDVGSMKMARAITELLDGCLATVDKRRVSDHEVEMGFVIGDVKDRTVVMPDDMISTAGTITQAADLVKSKGAKEVLLAATHGLFCGSALRRIQDCAVDGIFVTDTIPLNKTLIGTVTVLSTAESFAKAIMKIHRSSPIYNKFDGQ